MMKPKIIVKHVSYEVSKRLKELGFDLETIFYWKVVINATSDCRKNTIFCGPEDYIDHNSRGILFYSAPTRPEVIEWFRNKFGYYIYIIPRFDGFDGSQYGCHYSIFKEGDKEERDSSGDGSFTFEEAEDSAILEVLNLLEKEERLEILINENK